MSRYTQALCNASYVGNLKEEKSCFFNEISGVAILVEVLCCEYNVVKFIDYVMISVAV